MDNPGAGSDSALLPGGQPTAALVCTYHGLNGAAFTLAAHRTVDAAEARAADVRAGALSHLPGAAASCPSGDGSAVLLAFAFPTGPDRAVAYAESGCASIDNGRIRGTPATALVTDLTALGVGRP